MRIIHLDMNYHGSCQKVVLQVLSMYIYLSKQFPCATKIIVVTSIIIY